MFAGSLPIFCHRFVPVDHAAKEQVGTGQSVMYGGDYATDYAEPVRTDEIWPASPGNDGHPDLPRQNPESGQNSVRRISASWIAAQKALDADNPDNRASGLVRISPAPQRLFAQCSH